MTAITIILTITLLAGLAAHFAKLPPLVGFLAAGFILNVMNTPTPAELQTIADLGVTLMLFAIGLKFDARTLIRSEMWGSAVGHMVLSALVGTGFVGLMATILGVQRGEWGAFALIGFALSFSSTVLCVKVLEERSDDGSLYGQTAIGILVMQDLAAVAYMAVAKGKIPSPWALLVVAALIPIGWIGRRILARLARGELMVLFGVVLALVPGWYAFELVGLKGDLGALAIGMLLSLHPRSTELARSLFSIKELLLVGFFVSIGLHGLPGVADLAMAIALIVVQLPIQMALYLWLMRSFGLRNATATKAALMLSNFSEFGIIVAAVGAAGGVLDRRWLVIMALTVALSMVFSTVANRRGNAIIGRIVAALPEKDPRRIKEYDRPIDLGHADALVLGMGRIGRAAYDRLTQHGHHVIGIDNDEISAAALTKQGYRIVTEDATDAEFWERVRNAGSIATVLFAMPDHGSNEYAVRQLHEAGFTGRTSAVVRFPEEADQLEKLGVDHVFNLYAGAGYELADQTIAAQN